MKTAAEILTAAAELIERNGKAHGILALESEGKTADEYPMCALGAIGFVATGHANRFLEDDTAHEAVALLRDSLGPADCAPSPHYAYDPNSFVSIVGQWSDENDTATVVAKLRAVVHENDA